MITINVRGYVLRDNSVGSFLGADHWWCRKALIMSGGIVDTGD